MGTWTPTSSSGIAAGAVTVSDLATATVNAICPWVIDLNVWIAPASSSLFTGVIYYPSAAGTDLPVRLSTGAQNAYAEWPVILAAGTWTVTLLHSTDTNRGIYTFALDGTSIGTVDGYDAAPASGVQAAIAGVVVAATGKKLLRVTMATKNAAASDYFAIIENIRLTRTA